MEALAETGNVAESARIARYDKSTAYDRRHDNPEFAAQWEEAIEVATEKLELEARRRAYEGTSKGVWHNGELVGTEKVYSDTLMIFLLKAHRPEKYRDNFNVSANVSINDRETVIVEYITAPAVADPLADELPRMLGEAEDG